MKKDVKILIGFVPIELNPERPWDIRFNMIGIGSREDRKYYLSKPEYYKPSYYNSEFLKYA